jgi:uncharacterized protein YecE (DUF72 family)
MGGAQKDTKFVLHELRVTLRVVKNVTVSMDDAVAEWARLEAARRNTSVSRLLGELLAEKMRHDDAYQRALQDWQHRERSWSSDGQPYPGRGVL